MAAGGTPARDAKAASTNPASNAGDRPHKNFQPPLWVTILEYFLKFIVAILVAILAVVLYDVSQDRDFLDRFPSWSSERYFTLEELRQYNGEDPEKPIYLGFKGNVFDVTKGARHYGPKGGYHFFAGRDATRAFATGCFKEECLLSDLEGLTPEQLKGIDEWEKTYFREYTYVGKIRK